MDTQEMYSKRQFRAFQCIGDPSIDLDLWFVRRGFMVCSKVNSSSLYLFKVCQWFSWAMQADYFFFFPRIVSHVWAREKNVTVLFYLFFFNVWNFFLNRCYYAFSLSSHVKKINQIKDISKFRKIQGASPLCLEP